jgi:hypothetical protein
LTISSTISANQVMRSYGVYAGVHRKNKLEQSAVI